MVVKQADGEPESVDKREREKESSERVCSSSSSAASHLQGLTGLLTPDLVAGGAGEQDHVALQLRRAAPLDVQPARAECLVATAVRSKHCMRGAWTAEHVATIAQWWVAGAPRVSWEIAALRHWRARDLSLDTDLRKLVGQVLRYGVVGRAAALAEGHRGDNERLQPL